MQRISKLAAVTVAGTTAALVLAGCQGGSSGKSASSSAGTGSGSAATGASVTMTWWHNGTAEPLLSLWKQAAASYHTAHPNVTIKVVPIQNEQFTTKVPLALQSSTPPDVYFNQGGGLLGTQATSGRVADITSKAAAFVKTLGPVAAGWQSDGKQYGLPYDSHIVGFWYRKDLFRRAGIAAPPTTMTQFTEDVQKLKSAGIVPVAIGGKDRWPDAFYYDYFAVRECSVTTLQDSVKAKKFTDGCFTKAGQDVLNFLKSKPFQTGFNGTPAQQGAGSSAGLVANGKAAMELQGDWDPSVMQSLASSKTFKANLGWFAFPAISGAPGDPKAALGGGDGFSCTIKNVDTCLGFIEYLDGPAIQQKLVTSGAAAIPVNSAAAASISTPVIKQVFQYSRSASYIQTYFDIALPTAAGQALDDAAANMFAGQGGPDAVAKAVNAAG